MKTFNVYIIEIETDKAKTMIGSNLSESQAERREISALMRINDNFFVGSYEVGSEEDKKYQGDLLI